MSSLRLEKSKPTLRFILQIALHRSQLQNLSKVKRLQESLVLKRLASAEDFQAEACAEQSATLAEDDQSKTQTHNIRDGDKNPHIRPPELAAHVLASTFIVVEALIICRPNALPMLYLHD